jgi:hypothetical protein
MSPALSKETAFLKQGKTYNERLRGKEKRRVQN